MSNNDGGAVATVVAFWEEHNLFEPSQQDYDDHKLWYVAMECFYDLYHQRQDDIQEITLAYRISIPRVISGYRQMAGPTSIAPHRQEAEAATSLAPTTANMSTNDHNILEAPGTHDNEPQGEAAVCRNDVDDNNADNANDDKEDDADDAEEGALLERLKQRDSAKQQQEQRDTTNTMAVAASCSLNPRCGKADSPLPTTHHHDNDLRSRFPQLFSLTPKQSESKNKPKEVNSLLLAREKHERAETYLILHMQDAGVFSDMGCDRHDLQQYDTGQGKACTGDSAQAKQ